MAQRETAKDETKRTVYQGVGHTVELTDPATGITYPVRHLSIHASALAQHEAQRRQAEMSTIEAAIRRMQGLVNKYDDKTPEIIVRRVQEKAFKLTPCGRTRALEQRIPWSHRCILDTPAWACRRYILRGIWLRRSPHQ